MRNVGGVVDDEFDGSGGPRGGRRWKVGSWGVPDDASGGSSAKRSSSTTGGGGVVAVHSLSVPSHAMSMTSFPPGTAQVSLTSQSDAVVPRLVTSQMTSVPPCPCGPESGKKAIRNDADGEVDR